jgi:RHS repeat-associated protein
LTSAEDPDSEYAYTYDNVGRVLTVSNSGTSGVPTVVLTAAYNASGMRTSLSATKGGTADFLNTYSYDNLHRLTRVEQTGNGGATVADKRVNFAYNAIGQFTSIDRNYKNGGTWTEVATSTYTYDTLHRLTDLDHTHGATQIANYEWDYDHMNRVTLFSGPDGTSAYTYDKESQLTAADHSYQSDESYTFDATGNRTNGSYSISTNNRMTSDGMYNYTYDGEGNRLTRTKISDNSLTEYTWDYRNRLTKVVERATGSGGAITKETNYTYDVFDRRIGKSVDADGAGGGSAVVSRFVYDGDHIALQFDGSNNLTHRYLHGPAIDQILADEDALNDILWALTDNLGTVRDLVDDSGAVQNHIEYDSFGKVTAESAAAVDHLFGYTGRERDEETGLMYYRARYYDPATGRFISHDPIGFAAGDISLSRYVGNCVSTYVDPSGLETSGPQNEPSKDHIYIDDYIGLAARSEKLTRNTTAIYVPMLKQFDALQKLHTVNYFWVNIQPKSPLPSVQAAEHAAAFARVENMKAKEDGSKPPLVIFLYLGHSTLIQQAPNPQESDKIKAIAKDAPPNLYGGFAACFSKHLNAPLGAHALPNPPSLTDSVTTSQLVTAFGTLRPSIYRQVAQLKDKKDYDAAIVNVYFGEITVGSDSAVDARLKTFVEDMKAGRAKRDRFGAPINRSTTWEAKIDETLNK